MRVRSRLTPRASDHAGRGEAALGGVAGPDLRGRMRDPEAALEITGDPIEEGSPG
jgi:hypothetical protein